TLKREIASLNEIEECRVDAWTIELLEADKTEPEKAPEISTKATEEPVQKTASKKQATAPKKSGSQAIRVPLERLDALMNMVSELVIHRTRLEDISSKIDHKQIDEPLEEVGRISSELQELVLQLRMQPFSVVTQRFPRMIRDLAKDLDKD